MYSYIWDSLYMNSFEQIFLFACLLNSIFLYVA